MHLNKIGKLATQYWEEIPHHFPLVELGNYVVMPNHVHGILIINKMNGVGDVETLQCNVSTDDKNNKMAMISPKPGSISTIIRSYKSIVTKMARQIHADFGWQSRFHDHIIRNAQSYDNIQNYILQNPEKWQEDKFYS
jgi:REP element-mobilizing transposase RayT